ncbi:hypothetical protein ABIB40_003787 [Pedobacter sp. UYP30]
MEIFHIYRGENVDKLPKQLHDLGQKFKNIEARIPRTHHLYLKEKANLLVELN